MQSCIKLEVGRKDADPSLPFPRPSHSAANPPPRLFPREGDKIQSLQVAKGEGNSCSRDWSVTMAVGTRVTDTWTSTAHGRHQHWDVSRFRVTQTDRQRADVQTEIFVFLLLIYRWWSPRHWGLKSDLTSPWSEHFQLSFEISPADALRGKKKRLFVPCLTILVSLFLCGHLLKIQATSPSTRQKTGQNKFSVMLPQETLV